MTHRIVVMGVSGYGTSAVGEGLVARLGIPCCDGDDLHPPGSVQKMGARIPLTDDDRGPWLDRVAAVLATQTPAIVGCFALRRAYRDRLRSCGRPGAACQLDRALETSVAAAADGLSR